MSVNGQYVISNLGPGDLLLAESDIENLFKPFFQTYKNLKGIKNLDYKISSMWRHEDVRTWHRIQGGAMDFILQKAGDFAPVSEYVNLFSYMIQNWKHGAGVDYTLGNIHIHVDARETPYFFIEDHGSQVAAVQTVESFKSMVAAGSGVQTKKKV